MIHIILPMVTVPEFTRTMELSRVILIPPPLNISKILFSAISESPISRNKNTPDLDHMYNNKEF